MASADSAPSTPMITQPNATASDLVFVNSSGPKDHEEARRLIRANAMRDYWRRKKDQKVKYAKGIRIDKRTATERDAMPGDNLVHDRTFNIAWRIRDLPDSWAERNEPHVELRDNRLAELAIQQADECISFHGDGARIIYEQRREDAGRGTGNIYAWPISDQTSDLTRSPGLGVIDPFNMLPIGGSSEYNSFVLSHCKSPLSRSLSLSGLVRNHQGISANLMTKLFRLCFKTSLRLSHRANAKLS